MSVAFIQYMGVFCVSHRWMNWKAHSVRKIKTKFPFKNVFVLGREQRILHIFSQEQGNILITMHSPGLN